MDADKPRARTKRPLIVTGTLQPTGLLAWEVELIGPALTAVVERPTGPAARQGRDAQ